MKFLIFITTYNRPDMLLDLLTDIRDQKAGHDIEIYVHDDHSNKNYREVRQFLKDNFKHRYISNKKRRAKAEFWKTINEAFQYAKKAEWDYFIEFPDDIRLTPNFFERATKAMENTKNCICLNLITEFSRAKAKFWTPVPVVQVSPQINRTGWVDMCYLANRKFFELLKYEIFEVAKDWRENPKLSSGVGMQISKRIVKQQAFFHQGKKTFVIHDDHPSVMHPEMRKSVKLITNQNKDNKLKTASVASMPDREHSLKQTIDSIYPQVDVINVYLNEYPHVPGFLMKKGINVFRSQDELGDLGDVGKFFMCEKVSGYHFTIDDDLIYPPDYIATLIKNIEKHNRAMAISFHGRIFGEFPVNSYYHGHIAAAACLKEYGTNAKMHTVGTGVLGYHTDTIDVRLSDFRTLNMADIWFAVICNSQNVDRMVVAHKGNWIKHTKIDLSKTIAAKQHRRDAVQTFVMNNTNWQKLKTMAPKNGLLPEVAEKYYVPTIKPGKYNFKGFGDIDLRTIGLAKADTLFAKGFPFLKLKKPAAKPQPAPGKADKQAPQQKKNQAPQKPVDINEFRKNSGYIQKLLTLEWAQLNYMEKKIFFNRTDYFLEKKTNYYRIAEIDRRMKSLHAKMRAAGKSDDRTREKLMADLTGYEDEKLALWKTIDAWEPPAEKTERHKDEGEGKSKMKVEQAKKAVKKINAHNNYIWRGEKELEKNITDRRRKYLEKEIARRKEELEEMGEPYNRKSRK